MGNRTVYMGDFFSSSSFSGLVCQDFGLVIYIGETVRGGERERFGERVVEGCCAGLTPVGECLRDGKLMELMQLWIFRPVCARQW